MKQAIRLCLCFAALLLGACVTGDPHIKPDHWVMVINTATGQPATGVQLSYRVVRELHFLPWTNVLVSSDPYISDASGRAFVPGSVIMAPTIHHDLNTHRSWQEWELDFFRTYPDGRNKKSSELEILYVKKTPY